MGKRGAQPKPIPHWTKSGYQLHYHRQELPVCRDCLDAAAEYNREWRARKRMEALRG